MIPIDDAEILRLRLIAAGAAKLVQSVGDVSVSPSANCRARIWWIVHNNGKRIAYDADGRKHFLTCPDAEELRRRQGK